MTKRSLTEAEINDILSFLRPSKSIPLETATTIIDQQRRQLTRQLQSIQIYPNKINDLKQEIMRQFHKSQICPGENVGVLAATSIGEMQTQNTLNSIDWFDQIIYQDGSKNQTMVEPIGQMIDRFLANALVNSPDRIQHIPENRTEYLELPDGFQVPSCDLNGRMNWYRIEAVTRHLPVGQLVRVTTHSGRMVTATQSKSFLVWDGSQFQATCGKDVKIGDILPTTQRLNSLTNLEDHRQFLLNCLDERGMMMADHVQLWLTDQMMMLVSLTFSYFGIPTHQHPECLTIRRDLIETFQAGQMVSPNRDVFFDPVVSIEHVDPSTEYVYDLTVAETRNFMLFNGLNCRDTFHKAGLAEKSVTAGVPRCRELIDATEHPKNRSCYIHFLEHNDSMPNLTRAIGSSLVELTIKRLTVSSDIRLEYDEEKWYPAWNILYGSRYGSLDDIPVAQRACLSLQLNMDLLYEYRFSLEEIAARIADEYDEIIPVFSPPNIGRIDFFIDQSQLELPNNRLAHIHQANAPLIYLEEVVQPLLNNVIVCGTPGIKNIFYTPDENDDETKRWMVETDGSNLLDILAQDNIDVAKTYSDHIWEVYRTLGVEAARQLLINEFQRIMESINICHIKILVERMTFSGSIASISRYTRRKDDSGPLSKCSFEETVQNLVGAAANGETDFLRSCSAAIICGKKIRTGTGLCELRVDLDMLPQLTKDNPVESEAGSDTGSDYEYEYAYDEGDEAYEEI